MKTRTKIITGVVAAGVLAAVAVPRLLKPAQLTEQVTIPVVKAEQPENGTITLSKEVIGTVEPSDIIYVMPKVTGEIVSVQYREMWWFRASLFAGLTINRLTAAKFL